MILEEREDVLKKAAQTKRDLLASLKEQFLIHQRKKKNELSNETLWQNEDKKQEYTRQENLRHVERYCKLIVQ